MARTSHGLTILSMRMEPSTGRSARRRRTSSGKKTARSLAFKRFSSKARMPSLLKILPNADESAELHLLNICSYSPLLHAMWKGWRVVEVRYGHARHTPPPILIRTHPAPLMVPTCSLNEPAGGFTTWALPSVPADPARRRPREGTSARGNCARTWAGTRTPG